MFIDVFFIVLFVDNFGETDSDFLQKLEKNSSDPQNVGRDSVLSNFDPFFTKQVPVSKTSAQSRLSSTKEEESFSELSLKNIRVEQVRANQGNRSAENSFTEEFSQLISLDNANVKDMSVEIMKDINITSESDKIDPNIEPEDIKLW